MPHAPAVRSLAQRSWVDLLPWLVSYRHGPSILSDTEVIPNAWLPAAPADSLNPENFDRFCALVAERYVADRPKAHLASDFPTTVTAGSVSELELDDRIEKLLADNDVTTVAHVLAQSVDRLVALPGIERADAVDIVAGLVAFTARAPESPVVVAEHVPLDRDRHVMAFIDGLDDRDRLILHERIVALRPRTQSSLAAEVGLSRERVNQLDRSLRLQLADMVENSGSLRQLISEMLARANPIADITEVIDDIPELGAQLPTLDIPLWRLLGAGSGQVHTTDDWIVKGSVQEANSHVRSLLEENAGPESVVPLATIADALMLPVGTTARWLSRTGFAIIGEHAVAESGGTADLVAATLSISGVPLSFDDIVLAMANTPRSRSSIRNAIVTDDRIVKTDRTTYGLQRWGGEKYLPVHRQIGLILDEAGGKISVDALVEQIMAKYDVTESSIRAYAGAGEYTTRDDVVSRREKKYVHRKSPAKTRFLYRDGDTIRWRSVVSRSHVKGSAFNIPSALAGLLGVGPGSPVQLPSRLGPQSLMWVSVQARVGTIKRFITDLDLSEGDEIFLEFAPDDFDVKVYRPPDSADPLKQILAAIGRPDPPSVTSAELPGVLAAALWLPEESSVTALVDALRHRREDELADRVAETLG